MIEIKDIKVGNKVFHRNPKETYDIVDTSSRMKIDDEWIDCIIYKPNYNNDYTYFVRTIKDFIKNFTLIKE